MSPRKSRRRAKEEPPAQEDLGEEIDLDAEDEEETSSDGDDGYVTDVDNYEVDQAVTENNEEILEAHRQKRIRHIKRYGEEALDYLIRCLGPARAKKAMIKIVAEAIEDTDKDHDTHPAEWLLTLACAEVMRVSVDKRSMKGIKFSLKEALKDESEDRTPEGLVDFFQGALMQLPPKARAAVTLRGIEGRDEDEASGLLQMSKDEVSEHLHAGMESLRKIIKDYR